MSDTRKMESKPNQVRLDPWSVLGGIANQEKEVGVNRNIRLVIALGSVFVLTVAIQTRPAFGASCHACVTDCVSIIQETECDSQCNGAIPAEYYACFEDTYNFCTDPGREITECEVDI